MGMWGELWGCGVGGCVSVCVCLSWGERLGLVILESWDSSWTNSAQHTIRMNCPYIKRILGLLFFLRKGGSHIEM